MCLIFKSIKTADEDIIFYKAVFIKDGKFTTPFLNFPIEIGKEYTLDTNIDKLVKNVGDEIKEGVFHLYTKKPEDSLCFFLKTIVKKGEKYLEGENGDIGVTRVRYEYLNDEDKKTYEDLLKISKNYDTMFHNTNGLYKVLKDDKCNFINAEGKLLSEKWFDDVWDFSEGFAIVNLNDNYNFISAEGKLLSEKWFYWVGYFSEGFATVKLNDKWNFISTEGKLLSNKWFDYVWSFFEGFAKVKLKNVWYKIDTNGNIC